MARRKKINMDALADEGWRTPNTYESKLYGYPPIAPGIYLFAVFPPPMRKPDANAIIAYVGKSLSLAGRLSGHPILNAIYADAPDAYVQRWFTVLPAEHIATAEIEAIKRFNPPYNIQHRLRGLFV